MAILQRRVFMIAGVSTACLYPEPTEESLYDLAVNGISAVEIFVNTHSELRKSYAVNIAEILRRFDMRCVSVHPFTGEMEQFMLYSGYERRTEDILEYYKYFFRFMNITGAKVFVFHGGKAVRSTELYCERFSRLFRLGKEFGITVALENVTRCQSSSAIYVREIMKLLGDEFAFVLDTKQAVRAGEPPERFIEITGNKLVHVHISDSSEMGDCLPIGKGRADIRGLLRKIYLNNPECSVVLELYRTGFGSVGELVHSYNILSNMTKECELS